MDNKKVKKEVTAQGRGMYSIASLLRFIIFLITVSLAACSDTASQASNPDAANNNTPVVTSPLPVASSPLTAPQDLTVATDNGVVTLSWSDVSTDSANSTPAYNVYWNTTGNVTTSDTKIKNVASPYVVSGLTVGETYYFIITTVITDEESDTSFEIFAKAPVPVLISIDLQPADSSNISGSTVQLTAAGAFSDGSIIDITSAVDWSSVDTNLADIDDVTTKGLLSAANIGTTTITALDPISTITGSTTFRTQIDHAVFGSQQLFCSNSGCHSQLEWPTTHPRSSSNCATCHIYLSEPYRWKPFVAVDHDEVIGSCAGCHDGLQFIGKSTSHINSTDMCNACHTPDTDPSTPEWLVVAVDHAQVTGSCISCHDGVIAIGQKIGIIHTNVNDDCNACHSTNSFKPKKTMDHNSINLFVGCVTCHDGINARYKGGLHITSDEVCENCHVVSNWLN